MRFTNITTKGDAKKKKLCKSISCIGFIRNIILHSDVLWWTRFRYWDTGIKFKFVANFLINNCDLRLLPSLAACQFSVTQIMAKGKQPLTSPPTLLLENGEEKAAQKLLRERERKARNQRRYYEAYVPSTFASALLIFNLDNYSHKESQQDKARQRSAK